MFDPPVRHEGHNGWPGSGDRWCLPDPHSSGRSFSNWWAARACPPAGASTPVAPPPPPRGSVPGVGRARHRAAHGRRPTPSGRRRSSDVRGESSAPPRGGGRGGGGGGGGCARRRQTGTPRARPPPPQRRVPPAAWPHVRSVATASARRRWMPAGGPYGTEFDCVANGSEVTAPPAAACVRPTPPPPSPSVGHQPPWRPPAHPTGRCSGAMLWRDIQTVRPAFACLPIS